MPRRKAVHPQPLKGPAEESGEGNVKQGPTKDLGSPSLPAERPLAAVPSREGDVKRPAPQIKDTTSPLSTLSSSSVERVALSVPPSLTMASDVPSTSLPSEGAGEPLRRSTRSSSSKETSSSSVPGHTPTSTPSKGGRGNVKKTPIKKSKNVESTSSTESTPSKDADDLVEVKEHPDDEIASASDAGGDEKRNLSLEALFQVTHSELENMSRRQKTPVSPQKAAAKMSPTQEIEASQPIKAVDEPAPAEAAPPAAAEDEDDPINAPLVVAEEETTETDHTVSYVIQVGNDGEMTEHGFKLITLPAAEELVIESRSSSATPSKVSPAQSPPGKLHLPSQSRSLEQHVQLTYTTPEANPFTYASNKRPILKAYSEGDAAPEIPPDPRGRKRKHPARPGKHVCNYCGRGCTKPSVLQKHIRAHTGERPYPCIPCGFSFKTKSNLYKHCKSRAHAIKAGQAVPTSEEVGRLDSIDMMDESDDDNTSMSTSSDQTTTPEHAHSMTPTVSELTISTKPLMHRVSSTPVLSSIKSEAAAAASSPSSSLATTKVVMTDSQYYDLEYAPDVSTPSTSAAPQVSSQKNPADHLIASQRSGLGRSYSKKPWLGDICILPPKVRLQELKGPRLQTKGLPAPAIAPSKSSNQESTSGESQKASDHQMKVTIKWNPPKKDIKDVSPAEKRASLPRTIPPRIQPLDPKSPMTPEMLKERISQIISANSAIIDTPLADAPRPKRMSRQNSEVVASRADQTAPSTVSHTLARMMSAPCFDTTAKSGPVSRLASMNPPATTVTQPASMEQQYQVQNIVKVAQLPVASSAAVAPPTRTLTAPAGPTQLATPTSLPQEIKIQIKLPKPSSSPAPVTRAVTAVTLPQVLSQTTLLGQQAFLPAGQVLLTPTIQPGRNHNPNTGSVVKDLLLQSKGTPTPNKGHYISNLIKQHVSTPDGGAVTPQPTTATPDPRVIQLMEVASSEPSSQPQVMYVTQDVVPMQVAQQVEVAAKDTDTKQRTFLRSLSVPITMGAPLTPSSSVPNLTFDQYDPLTPPKRGRPKGSRNLPKGSPAPQDTTISPLAQELRKMPVVSDSMKSVFKLPMFNTVSPVNLVPTTGSPYNLKLKIPPRTLAAFSHSNTITPMVTPSVGPYLSLTPSVTSSLTPGVTPAVTPAILATASTSLPTVGIPSTPSLTTLLNSPLPQQETPTTQSLCKLKLKGKILMKRSMSVEKMLSQERDKMDNRALSNIKISELLRRSQSVDDSVNRKRDEVGTPSVGDNNSIIAKLLKQHRQLGPSPLAAASPLFASSAALTTTTTTETEMKVMVLGKTEGGEAVWESVDAKVETLSPPKSQQMMMPTNEVMSFVRPGAATLSPHLSSSKNYSNKLHFIPTLLLSKLNETDSPPSAANKEKDSPVKESGEGENNGTTASFTVNGGTPEKSDQGKIGSDVSDAAGVVCLDAVSPIRVDGAPVISEGHVEVKSPLSDNKGLSEAEDDAEGMEWETSTPEKLIKKPLIPGLPDVPVSAPDIKQVPLMLKDLPEKELNARLLLLAHAYPILRNHTYATFCTVVKPQPMYVAQAGNQKLSMYSNWRSATYNPNPMGLLSKELMELYHSRWYDVDPLFCSAGKTTHKDSIFTHSSYWQFQNDSPGCTIKPEEMSTAAVQEVSEVVRLTNETRSTGDDVPIQPVTVQIITTPGKTPSKEGGSVKEPKRVQLFAGGYKSNEDYTYIRGRGRGKYVCEECGIRCKKPSMLKKHIRTHTDLRPYHCNYCAFSFKTKGNLTKHMKSKTHHKRCYELGIIPVPTDVTDEHIDMDALAKQVALAKQSHILGMGEDSTLDDDEEDEEEEEDMEGSLDASLDASIEQDVEEEGPIDQPMEEVIVIDKAGEIIQTINTEGVSDLTGEKVSGDGPWYVAIQEPDSVQPTFVCIEQNSQPHTTVEEVVVTAEETTVTPKKEKGGDKLRPSIDKEIAHSLLDLSKAPDTQPPSPEQGATPDTTATASTNKPKLRRQQSVGGSEESAREAANKAEACRLSGLIGELMSRTVKNTDGRATSPGVSTTMSVAASTTTTVSMATSPLSAATVLATDKESTSQGIASSVVMTTAATMSSSSSIQSFLESQGMNISTAVDPKSNTHMTPIKYVGAGFVPPVLFGDDKETACISEPVIGISKIVKPDVSPVPLVFPSSVAVSSSSSPFVIQGVEMSLPEPDQEGNAAARVIEAQIVTHEIAIDDPPLIAASSIPSSLPLKPSSVQLHTVAISMNSTTSTSSHAYSQSQHSSLVSSLPHRPIISATISPATRVTKANILSTQTSGVHMLQLHGAPGVAPPSIPVGVKILPVTSASSKLHFATGENKAPYEIIPIPGRVLDNRESLVDGKWVCNVCGKTFLHEPQLTLHQKIHLLEKPYRCEDCTLSFRTKALLQKHQKSEGHMAKLNVNQQFGAPSSDNPRPYKCDDCGVAFRIYGHLAKHVRSKLHITTLEKLGVLPPGSFAQMESSGQLHADSKDDSGETSAQPQGQGHILQGQPQLTSTPLPSSAISTASLTQFKTTDARTVGASPIRDQFPYHHGYERDVQASNERVTVEIQSELIDFGEISSRGEHFVEKFDVDRNKVTTKVVSQAIKSEEAGVATGSSGVTATAADAGATSVVSSATAKSAAAHKCGICGQTFKAIIALKQHLVSHAELRPYVCEYCDAGFTRAQALQFHLRTHMQDRPYLCGECGETFVSTDHLQGHSLTCVGGNRVKTEGSSVPASKAPDGLVDSQSHLSAGGGTASTDSSNTLPPSIADVPETVVELSDSSVSSLPPAETAQADTSTDKSQPTIVIDQALKQQITQLIRENPINMGKIQVVDVETGQIRDIQVDPNTGDIVLLGLMDPENQAGSETTAIKEQESAVASIDPEGNNNDLNKGSHEKIQLPVVDTKVGLIDSLPTEFAVVHAETGITVEHIQINDISSEGTSFKTEFKVESRGQSDLSHVSSHTSDDISDIHADSDLLIAADPIIQPSSPTVVSSTQTSTPVTSSEMQEFRVLATSSTTSVVVDVAKTQDSQTSASSHTAQVSTVSETSFVPDNVSSESHLHSSSVPGVLHPLQTTDHSLETECESGVETEADVKIDVSLGNSQGSSAASPVAVESQPPSHNVTGHGRLLRKQFSVDVADGVSVGSERSACVEASLSVEVPLSSPGEVQPNIEQCDLDDQPGESLTSDDLLMADPIVRGYPDGVIGDSSQSDNETGLVIAMETSNSQSDQDEAICVTELPSQKRTSPPPGVKRPSPPPSDEPQAKRQRADRHTPVPTPL